MNRLRLDYQRSMKPFPLAGAILLLMAIAMLILIGDYYYDLTVRTASWEDSLKKFEQTSGGRADDAEQGRWAGDIKQANEVLRQLTTPWEGLFKAVESSTDAKVTLLSMAPDIEKHVVAIGCEAKNVAAMLNFIKRLEKRQEFDSVYLQSHQIQEYEPERPVRFSLIVFWRTAA